MTQKMKIIFQTAAWRTSVLAAVLSCTLATPALAAPTDAWITTKIKLALLTTEGISSRAVSVDTINHQVTLHGKVRSGEEREKAESVAKNVDGVQGVRNLLQVVTPQHEQVMQQSDDRIKTQVAKALKAGRSLKDSSISVQSVNNGTVLLGGTAKTLGDHLSAVEVAAGVPGVRRVTSEIQSSDTLGDAEIWRDSKQARLSKAAYGAGNAARDVYITSVTKMRLLADSRTPALDINVDTRDGVVTLFGMVPTKDAKHAAEADARKVSGVRHIMNELQVVPTTQQAVVKGHDDDIERDMKKTFQDHADFKDISIQVKNCAARLTGTVPNGMERLDAAVVARSTLGVCSVQDDLRIAD
jgi:osmotically-inducible protein OsmY